MKRLLLSVLAVLLSATMAHALTASWDRSPDGELVIGYELYVCIPDGKLFATVCSPLGSGVRLGEIVPQPPVAAPIPPSTVQRVEVLLPSLPPLGQLSVVAVDVNGFRSNQSNIVPFRQLAIAAPKGLVIK